jgi:peptide-methionine (S)-S-oxide reductase
MDGVVSTRVGYTGGTKKNPTYHSLGDHTETVQIDFDPTRISYEQLLDVFWKSHDPAARSWSRQYRSIILYHNSEQKRLALESMTRLEERLNGKIHTEIAPAGEFYPAEDYHQKYYLRSSGELMRVLRGIYPTEAAMMASTAAARLNGFSGGAAKGNDIERQLKAAGLSPEEMNRIHNVLSGEDGRTLSCPSN